MEAVPLIAGALAAALIAPGALRAFAEAGWTRVNYRDAALPFPAGVVAVVAAVLSLGALALIDAVAGSELVTGEGPTRPLLGTGRPAAVDALAAAPLLLGVAFLGLVDDLFGGAPRGWRGHFGAVLRGGWSTGVLKAVGTAALAVAVLAPGAPGGGDVLLAVAVIALATNLFNLLDLRPGRSVKAFVLVCGALLVATWDAAALDGLGVFAGPLLVIGLYDLRERAMLGDTGSNLLGAVAGVWLVAALDTTGQAIAAALLLALTVYGELASFTATIERVAPLRALDRLGRPGGATRPAVPHGPRAGADR